MGTFSAFGMGTAADPRSTWISPAIRGATEQQVENLIRDIASVQVDDGACFDVGAVRMELEFVGLPKGARIRGTRQARVCCRAAEGGRDIRSADHSWTRTALAPLLGH